MINYIIVSVVDNCLIIVVYSYLNDYDLILQMENCSKILHLLTNGWFTSLRHIKNAFCYFALQSSSWSTCCERTKADLNPAQIALDQKLVLACKGYGIIFLLYAIEAYVRKTANWYSRDIGCRSKGNTTNHNQNQVVSLLFMERKSMLTFDSIVLTNWKAQ